MPVDIQNIVDKCFLLARIIGGKQGLALATAVKDAVSRVHGADERLRQLYHEIPASTRALA